MVMASADRGLVMVDVGGQDDDHSLTKRSLVSLNIIFLIGRIGPVSQLDVVRTRQSQ